MKASDVIFDILYIAYRGSSNIEVYLEGEKDGNTVTGVVTILKEKLQKAIELRDQNRLVSIEEIEQL
jgi:hypothetical protein